MIRLTAIGATIAQLCVKMPKNGRYPIKIKSFFLSLSCLENATLSAISSNKKSKQIALRSLKALKLACAFIV
jgi:hypothetical protein